MLAVAVAMGAVAQAPAAADPLGQARERASQLHAQLADLQLQADAAVEQYDGAQVELARTVTERLSLDRALATVDRSASDARTTSDTRARALYMSGGPTALYAGVLSSADPAEVLMRWHAVSRVLSADQAGAARSAAGVGPVARAQQRAQAAALAQIRRTQQVQALAVHVQDLLDRQASLIASADADVLRLAREQQERERRAAEAAFAGRLAAARLAAARLAEQQTAALVSGSLAALRTTGSGLDLPAGSGTPGRYAEQALAAARTQLGKPYLWGATGPDAFDCSGLTGWAYAAAGVVLPRVAADQYLAGSHPRLADLAPGDLLFWGSAAGDPRSIHHEAMYLGDGMMIAAPHSGDVVKVQPVYASGFFGATRIG